MHVLFTYLKDIACPRPGYSLSREISDTSAALAQLGVRVTVLTGGAEENCPRCSHRNLAHLSAHLLRVIPVTRLDEMRLEALLQSNLSLLARMAFLQMRGEKVDLIHCFGWEAGLASGLYGQLNNVPLVCSIQDVIRQRSPWLIDPQLAYPRYVTRWLIRRSRLLICPDHYARDKIQDLFLVKDEDLAVLSPLPPPVHTDAEGEVSLREMEPKILYVGPVGPESGVDDLLWACSQLISRGTGQLQLILATSGQFPEILLTRKTIRKLRLAQHVQFLDQGDPGGLPRELFGHIRLLVMPGEVEFVGNLIFEALANGIPVVAADGGALSRIIENGVNGLKFSRGHVRSLAQALEAALFDPQFQSQMAQGARQQVRRRPEVGPGLLEIYQQACADPGILAGKGGDADDLRFSEFGGGGGI